jgi:hypothetical protein
MIDCLYVNGCSWTYGSDLELERDDLYRTTNNWAGRLGRSLELEVINGSAPGAGNDRILRTTTKDVLELVEQGRKPLIVIAWSSLQRFELPEGQHVGRWRPFVGPGMKNPPVADAIFQKWSNDHSDLVRWIQSVILLDCLAKTYDLPFFSTCIFWTNWTLLLEHAEHAEIATYFKTLKNQVGIDRHSLDTSLMKLVKAAELPLSKYSHPLEDGHAFIAQWFEQALRQKAKFTKA